MSYPIDVWLFVRARLHVVVGQELNKGMSRKASGRKWARECHQKTSPPHLTSSWVKQTMTVIPVSFIIKDQNVVFG
jgi:hypothetical protein